MNKILRFSDSEKVFQCPICKTDLKLKQNLQNIIAERLFKLGGRF